MKTLLKKEHQALRAKRMKLEEEGMKLLSRMDEEQERLDNVKATKLGIQSTDVLEVFRPAATDKKIPENIYKLNGKKINEAKFDEIFQFFPVLLGKKYGEDGILTLCGRKAVKVMCCGTGIAL